MKKLLLVTALMWATTLQIKAQNEISQNFLNEENADIVSNKTDPQKMRSDLPFNSRQNNYVRPTAEERFKRYLNKTVGTGLIGVGISSTIQQIADNPPEWEKNGKGFARRLGSNLGENAIQETVAYGFEETFKLDSKFYKSQKHDLGSRVKNGLLSGITARTPSGKRVFNPSPIIGAYTANLISTQLWYPKRFSYKDGLRQGTQNVGFSIGFGLINEFLLNRK